MWRWRPGAKSIGASGRQGWLYVSSNPLVAFDLLGTHQKSPDGLLLAVPGQGAWDASVNAWEDERYGWSVAYAGAMVGEQVLWVVTLGQSQAWRTGAMCATNVATKSAAPALEAGEDIVAQMAQKHASSGYEGLSAFMSEAEKRAFLANPAAGSRFLGQAVHNATDLGLREQYPGRFIYSRIGPDFLDTTTGNLIELTTTAAKAAHASKVGYENVLWALYNF
ncbi:hypothetical protein ISN75_05515 [Dyella marensis]|uniref:hypothetical protein n=1 Tax=Dyella marensis TaxID=500610 RepID=UPI0031D51E95